ncbi:unnamed protein product [Tilletia controversa]|uniref:cellulase n=3 Tax=Tilletia TaxID=13289 RepID=A0A8X7MJ14_9BASI|nr:hypothetical protein CF336_g8550 [Tilletia laevis]KAE8238066.1 hypothetical protein A4X06_0g9008 [Tilletia controversa]KAE8240754.1 hypothetical protein A4X03_0g8393 [Tilletia caries]KAE8182972.1 hypothetical protein CF335_g8466 [Tilletia laevis]CAD6892501.1 unnamed protein product [Tilletia caries]
MRLLGQSFFVLFTSVLILGADAEHDPALPGENRRGVPRTRRQWQGQHYPGGNGGRLGANLLHGLKVVKVASTTPLDPLHGPRAAKVVNTSLLAPLHGLKVAKAAREVKEARLEAGQIATQYWDCCKVGAAWPGHPAVNRPAYSCAKDGVTRINDPRVTSGCQGGTAFACNNQQPFVSPSNPMLSYAVGARPSTLGVDSFYGACYSIHFQELPGKTLVFQAINTGNYPTPWQIDIQTPGGGVGELNTCPSQWGSPPDGWGRRWGGIMNKAQCSQLPSQLQPGCHWRFDWLVPPGHPYGLNPKIASMCRVKCPKILTDRTGMIRKDDGNFPSAPQ